MSSTYTQAEVAIRCRVRITSVAISSADGENREMICTMVHGENLQSTHSENLDETYGVDISKTDSAFVGCCNDYQIKSSNNISPKNTEASSTKRKIGPRLMFRPVPKPPSRPQSQVLLPKGEVKAPIQVDQASPLPVYNGSSGKANPVEAQSFSKLRGVQSSYPASVRAAAMFAVKKGTATDLVDDEIYAVCMDHVAAVNLKPSLIEDRQTDTDLIDIITIYGGVLQLSFYYHHEQDLLLGFLQAFLLPSVINIQTCVESSAPCIDRSESSRTMDMEKLLAREMEVRILNEGFWEKFMRRTTRWLSRTEEMCFCDSDSNVCKSCSDEVSKAICTELEFDNGELALSTSIDSHIIVTPAQARKDDRIPKTSQSIVEGVIDERDDSIREDRYKQ